MSHKVSSLLVVLLALAIAAGNAQTKPLTNDDIVQMTKAGFDEQTIVKAITANKPDFDTSAQGLLVLKNAGVTKPVLDAILDRENNKAGAAASSGNAEIAPEPVPGLPREPGAYYKGASGWVRLQNAPSPETKTKGIFMANIVPGSSMKFVSVYRGKEGSIEVSERMPTFYVRDLAKWGRDVDIVQLEVKKNTREVRGASMSMFSMKNGPEHVADAVVSQLSEHVVRITPKSNLKNGEYLLGVGDGHIYDFGIKAGKD
jgi:hypothetical protein